LVVKAYLGIEAYKQAGTTNWFFGTLTMHRKWSGAASVTNFRKNWNKFYQRMKRATKGKLYYVLLPESHKDGSLHVHIISTCQTDTRWWKDNAARCGMGFKSENQPIVSTVKAAFYVSKYVGKSLGVSAWPANLRRIRFSLAWPKPIQDDTITWTCVTSDVAKYAVRKRLEMGYKIVNAITGEVVNVKPHSKTNRNRLLLDTCVSAERPEILARGRASAPGVGTAKDALYVSIHYQWDENSGHQHWD
jgi:hypothetical protein